MSIYENLMILLTCLLILLNAEATSFAVDPSLYPTFLNSTTSLLSISTISTPVIYYAKLVEVRIMVQLYFIPILTTVALVNNLIVLLVLLPPILPWRCKIGAKLPGPKSIQRYYVLLAVSEIISLSPSIYYILGVRILFNSLNSVWLFNIVNGQ